MLMDHRDPFIQSIDKTKGIEATRDLADKVMALPDLKRSRVQLMAGNHVNPFFVPRQTPPINSTQALYFLSQLRMAAANGPGDRIVVSAPMKTGSTFVSQALYIAFGMQPVNLMMLTMRPFDYALYGAATREHEIDELALLHACLETQGFVAHHHMLCSPMLASQAELYGLKFILFKRNIFDCLVSLDDFCRKVLAPVSDSVEAYRRRQLPPGWLDLGDDARMRHLLDAFLPFYVNYHTSWKVWQSKGLVSPLWISYEDDLLSDKAALAAKLCGWLGRPELTETLLAEFERQRDGEQFHFNKGISGRGASIQGANRERVLEAFAAYRELADWSEILG